MMYKNEKYRIDIGDIVHVNIECAQTTISKRAEVLYIPGSSGDSWVFRDMDEDKSIYVSEGCTIILLEKKENKND